MKRLYLIGGSMGVGKSATCRELKNKILNSVYLDGDVCWDMNPFRVNQRTCEMVIENICFLLNNFLRCPDIDTVIFGWVMHRQDIIDDILERVDTEDCEVYLFSLVCSEQELVHRIQSDIDSGRRKDDGIKERALSRLPMYEELDTVKIDTTCMTAKETAEHIIAISDKFQTDV